MKKSRRKIILTCMLTVIVLIAAALFFPTWTPAISGEYSKSQLKQIHINGADHEVMIRGVLSELAQ